MNIFVLDQQPVRAAQMHCDKHVCKMSIEYPQLLSTAHHLCGGTSDTLGRLYKPTHAHHPATRWVSQHPAHYQWLYELTVATWAEYTHRYGKTHASSRLQPWLINGPTLLQSITTDPVPPPQCMPVELRSSSSAWNDVILAYQRYYREVKASIATWKHRQPPDWFRGTV